MISERRAPTLHHTDDVARLSAGGNALPVAEVVAAAAALLNLQGSFAYLEGQAGGAWRSGEVILRARSIASPSRLALARALLDRGVPVVAPYTLESVTWHHWRIEAWHWVAGECGVTTRQAARATAKTFELLHAADDLAGRRYVRHPSLVPDSELAARFQRVQEWFCSHGEHWGKDTLVHADAHPGNVIYDNGVATLIDLDTLGRGPAWWDVTEILVDDRRGAAAPGTDRVLLETLGLPMVPTDVLAEAGWLRRRFAAWGL